MTPEDPPPNPDELLAMAYADGELDADSRADLEARLGADPALALQVTHQQRLNLLMRKMAPQEPKDAEWARLAEDPLHRTGVGAGFSLTLAAALGVLVLTSWGIVNSDDITTPWKLVLIALAVGVLALFLTVLRARLRTLPYDPYTSIER